MKYEVFDEEILIHSLFGGGSTGATKHKCVKARLRSEFNGYLCNFTALNQNTIASYIPVAKPSDQVVEELRCLKIEPLTDMAGPIDILIGADVAGKIWSGKREILSSGIVAMETLFGWTLMGTCKKSNAVRCSSNLATTFTMTTIAEGDVADLWKLEAIGISDPGEKENKEERRAAALRHFQETVDFVDGRYQVRLPWYDIVEDLPTNRDLAETRLESTLKKIGKTEALFENYDAVFNEWLQLNIIEKTDDDLRGHYLPHRPVVRESSSTTKVRPVFDASAKIGKSPSLNDCLEQGPNLIELLPDILLRFREKAIGVSADIEKAFLQISIHPEDRQYLKFLWKDNAQDLITLRHTRVVFGVTCSPFLLAAVLDHHLSLCIDTGSSADGEMLSRLKRGFYVDNLAMSVGSIAEGEKLRSLATNSLARGGFNLRGWEFSYDDNPREASPLLGLKWDREADLLSLNLDWWESTSHSEALTKRSVLSMTQRIFDPIGFSVPATVELKLMLQNLWGKKIGWDDPLGEEDCRTFETWRKQVKLLRNIAVRRNMGTLRNPSLHLFCDASGKAYAACVFLRSEREDGQVIVSLVQAKSRVAPLKGLTMPRLELMGVVIGARLLKSIQDALGWANVPTYAWCDSSTVLAWIQRQEEWSVFVRNRVKEVRELTPQVNWRHIPGQFNPADLPSRGCSIEQLVRSRWWDGPPWLRAEENGWPLSSWVFEEEAVSSERLKRSTALVSTNLDHSWVYHFFSKYEKIVRMVGWINRFVFNCRNRLLRRRGSLSVEELKVAENMVCRLVQEEVFPSLTDKSISDLRPFKDEFGVIRLQTRISERDDLEGFTTPILLPSDHPVVLRLVYDFHCRNNHVGAATLWSLMREHFWILRGRQLTRNIVRKCVTCKRFSGKSFDVESPPLPPSRVSDAAVFEVVGVDYAGPLVLRDGQKVWVALFTCGVFRAVHLELVTSLSTDAFMMALRRFIARRGRPKVLYSDNGTCFHGTNNAFATLDWRAITTYSSVERIEWRFNPPSASWWGGFYERMVQTVKRLLRRTLGRACLDLDELHTILCECESLVNSRPITPSSENNVDPLALTPAAFLQDIKCSGTPDCDAVEGESMNHRLRYRLEIRQQLRERFRTEYLGNLKWTHRRGTREPRIGEVVLIGSDELKRVEWPIGRIQEIVHGRDGLIRVLHLRTAKGMLTRPLQRVFPLEVEMALVPQGEAEQDDIEILDALENFEHVLPDPVEDDVAPSRPQVTRVGRAVRAPERLDL